MDLETKFFIKLAKVNVFSVEKKNKQYLQTNRINSRNF